MRIDRLDLTAFGPFTSRTLDLSEGDSGLHLIYGDNEAGKSTSLRALIAWLFGIPERTSDNYLHDNPQLRIGGKLRLSDGKSIEFVRRKGRKDTVLEPETESALEDAILLPFLSGIDESLFTKLYGIDYGRLIAGGEELLNQSGDLGQALFSAAVGATASLRELLAELQSGAEELFRPRASKKPVNQAISNYKDAQKRIREATLPVREWKRLQKDFKEIDFAVKEMDEKINEKSKEENRLARLKRVMGPLAERRTVTAQMEALGQVLLLPEDFNERRKTAMHNLQIATENKEKAEARLSRLNAEAETLNVRGELFENEEAILAIQKELGAVEKTVRDRPMQDGKRRMLRNEAETLLKTVHPDLALDEAEGLRTLLNKKKWISGLAKKHDLLSQKAEKADTSLQDAEEERKGILKKLGEVSSPSDLDLGELKASIAAARKAGDLEQRLSDARKRAGEGKRACENELARLGRFSGTIEGLLKAAMPVSETLDRFEKRFDEINESIRDQGRKLKEMGEERKGAEGDLKALLLKSDVPTVAVMEEARRVRNRGWSLIKGRYIEKHDAEEEIEAFAPDGDLVAQYEKSVQSVDHVSDRLRLDADQVVKRADLEARIQELRMRMEEIGREAESAKEREKTCQKEWDEIWEPLGIEPGMPREMKQWLLRAEKLLANVQAAMMAAGDAEKLARGHEALKEAVSLQIAKFDDSIDTGKMHLEGMISLCEDRVEQEEAALEGKRRLEHSSGDAEIRIRRLREELNAIESDRSHWRTEWAQAIDGLGLHPDVHPEHATETFDRLVSFFDKFDKSEELRRRIYGMDRVQEDFEDRVFGFADTIGFKREGMEAGTIAAQLHRDLNDAREARASLKKIESQIKEVTEEIENAGITIRNGREQLAALREQAGVETDEALEPAGERSRKKRELGRKLDALEQELTRSGDGLSTEALEKEAEECETDAIDAELERVSIALRELKANRDALRDQRQTLQYEINAKDGSADAANASEEAEEHLAAMLSGAEQYLRLQTAALILEQQIEAYRKKNQAPVLARAGQLFSRLTLGSYTSLRDELDNGGKPILLGVRPDNTEVPVEGMSEGTRDQLYLSLRLSTLEQHLSRGEPLPFVVDDILIGFDDRRTKVCLEVLADLAGRTQVLLFTHHRRVIELADGMAAKAGVFTHELS